MKEHKLSIKQLASEVNYSNSTISRYLSGKYEADASKIEARLEDYLRQSELSGNVKQFPQKPFQRADFFKTGDAISVIGVCRGCQQKAKMGVITGRIGFGKTLSLKKYAALERVRYIRCDSYIR
jgi:DNA transposition AAA+ family ATPase